MQIICQSPLTFYTPALLELRKREIGSKQGQHLRLNIAAVVLDYEEEETDEKNGLEAPIIL